MLVNETLHSFFTKVIIKFRGNLILQRNGGDFVEKSIKGFTVVLSIICTLILIIGIFANIYYPSSFKITPSSKNNENLFIGISLQKSSQSTLETNLSNNNQLENKAQVMLCNIIPIKNVAAIISNDIKVIPCGTPFGIKMFTKGVMVVKIDSITVDNSTSSPGKSCGLQIGDVITSVNGAEINTNEELLQIVACCKGENINLKVERSGETKELIITPIKSGDCYRIGVWVRDSSAGIGTVTFYEPTTGYFGGLGHGICDIDTGKLLPLENGEIISANLDGVIKGKVGTPGSLNGHFTDVVTGNLYENKETGVYGILNTCPSNNEEIYVATKQEVKPGAAEIICTLDDNVPQRYSVEIESVNYNCTEKTKNLVIKITDPELLSKTGGIVQGMSGSPIIQNNKLVGAVTHVFVNEPEKGYGIFAENMLLDYDEEANNWKNNAA